MCELLLHKDTQASLHYFDERITPQEAHVVPLQMSVYDNYDKFMIIKRSNTLVLIRSSSGISRAKNIFLQYRLCIHSTIIQSLPNY